MVLRQEFDAISSDGYYRYIFSFIGVNINKVNDIDDSSEKTSSTDINELNPTVEQRVTVPIHIKFILIIFVFIFIISCAVVLLYFRDKNAKNNISTNITGSTEIETTQSPRLSYPTSDTEIILFSGILHKDLRFDSQPWYRLPNGSYEPEFDKQNDGNFLLKVLDKNGKTIDQYMRDTKSMFTMLIDPGGAIDTDEAPIGISTPYGWSARYITLEIDGKIIFREQIYVKLLNDYLDNLSGDTYNTSKDDFNNKMEGILTNFRIRLEENNDIEAARILEYDLLPIIQAELQSNIKKDNLLKTNKEDIVELITNTIARLNT